MKVKRALEIVSYLANGIEPQTGEIFPEESTYQHPETIRALFLAIKGLERLEKQEARELKLPQNAGKGWGNDEDNLLIKNFDEGNSLKIISEMHGRTEGSIRSRLLKLGKIELPWFHI